MLDENNPLEASFFVFLLQKIRGGLVLAHDGIREQIDLLNDCLDNSLDDNQADQEQQFWNGWRASSLVSSVEQLNELLGKTFPSYWQKEAIKSGFSRQNVPEVLEYLKESFSAMIEEVDLLTEKLRQEAIFALDEGDVLTDQQLNDFLRRKE